MIYGKSEQAQYISTHSLTRRLTFGRTPEERSGDISTHSLTRRLTEMQAYAWDLETFQLTASQGG